MYATQLNPSTLLSAQTVLSKATSTDAHTNSQTRLSVAAARFVWTLQQHLEAAKEYQSLSQFPDPTYLVPAPSFDSYTSASSVSASQGTSPYTPTSSTAWFGYGLSPGSTLASLCVQPSMVYHDAYDYPPLASSSVLPSLPLPPTLAVPSSSLACAPPKPELFDNDAELDEAEVESLHEEDKDFIAGVRKSKYDLPHADYGSSFPFYFLSTVKPIGGDCRPNL